jgi:protein-S-isoprenylcysteine O-methyltransferase Ste14
MAKLTPEQEARYALDYGLPRSDLPEDVRLAYDRLVAERHSTDRWISTVVTVLSFPFGPGLIVVLLPWLIMQFRDGSQPWPLAVRVLGVVLIALGGITCVATFARFAVEGVGTPFPTNPPSSRKVMVGGPYRYVRNPMYVSYFVVIIGEALLLSRPVLFIYLLGVAVFVVAFVRWWEEPTMAKRFGAEYEAYRKNVPGWWPRWPRRPSGTEATVPPPS